LAAALNDGVASQRKSPASLFAKTAATTFPAPSFAYRTTNSGSASLFVSTPKRMADPSVTHAELVAGLSNVRVAVVATTEVPSYVTAKLVRSPRALLLGPLSFDGSTPLDVEALAAALNKASMPSRTAMLTINPRAWRIRDMAPPPHSCGEALHVQV
jgi:hypothetical protein